MNKESIIEILEDSRKRYCKCCANRNNQDYNCGWSEGIEYALSKLAKLTQKTGNIKEGRK